MQHAASFLRFTPPVLLQRAVTALRTPRHDRQSIVLVQAFAAEIQRTGDLAAWLVTLADVAVAERTFALRRRADEFRAAWSTFGLAHTLDRLAARPLLFQAVAAALDAASKRPLQSLPAFAQAA